MDASRRGFLIGAASLLAAPAIVRVESLMPVRAIRDPVLGFVPCDGRVLFRASYPDLFASIGTTYGGDGVTTFAVPDLRGAAIRYSETGPVKTLPYEVVILSRENAGWPAGAISYRPTS